MIKTIYYLGKDVTEYKPMDIKIIKSLMGNTLDKNVVIVSGNKANGVATYCKAMSQLDTKVYVYVETAHDVSPELLPDVIQYIALLDLTKTMKGDD